MLKSIHFNSQALAYLLVAPQVIITLVFFIWPAGQALYQSFLIEDAFGLGSEFVWFENFIYLFEDDYYGESFGRTALFSFLVAVISMSFALFLAGFAERVVRGGLFYKTLLIWPYAVAPVLAGALWVIMFDPSLGIITYFLKYFGIDWNYKLNGNQAMTLVVMAAAWKQVAYNFLFFLAGIHAIPKSMIEAAAIDGSGPVRRFWTIIFPLISPVTFFLLVINTVYAFFDTFGIIHVMTQGGPAKATEILVYKVYNDGFIGLDLGGSAAQSVILMFIVISLTVIQFRYIEKKVEYK
ncbi:MAG TPA: sn-glycerol-3-phosphate ABC transporter permease UgpA [SAR324 cluster bacterium]|jgi:sn-glycerol 3-phosphate transport system permease protein|nr:sn-glycerol-3-phosphate ABC transporter permease UgpA [Deltaproteobacteria bacterium]MAD99997.1 sn-glycerol-3-phosphate ABC transporter permease UgpA [Pseudomonadota bacterium]MDP6090491.1 sn-glycerol-3-phosphate ABC transporter permease UgpA [SAR324 cluster bacterium]MDP7127850.1 sn-glycerol-3-phosphate ABC transporter permease UgpA [Candidatus Neomarinimicrobiota bacterium]MBP44120.1 sn-glycerol-3-phosphate ABC transporter permease UgpA [Deltaproteobacteria bacterium]|tara:strand:- start:455 stop:1339 length:885 start_codon:yes stop_codon:yes gene_type:complete